MSTKTLDTKTRNLILILFLIGVFMGSLDTGIIGPVLPSIEQSFNLTSRDSSWIFTLFVIAFMIGSPIMAKFSDFYGRKKIFILDVLLFGIGSFLIASSMNIESILLGRVIQGFGCGGIFPVAGAFIGDGFPLEERGKALGILGSVFGISAIGGPLVGAALIPFGWNWCFTINIPISIFLIIFADYILPDLEKQRKLKIDYSGIILLSLLAIFLSYGLNQIDSSNFMNSILSFNVLPFLIIFIILIPIFFIIEKRAQESIVPIHMLRNKEISIACIETLCYGIVYSSAIFIPSLVILSMGLNNQSASGSEHLFAHALDKIAKKPALHGEQCGVGTIMMMHLHGGDWKFIQSALKAVKAPTNIKELGITEDELIQALVMANSIRPERYTILGDNGITEEAAIELAIKTEVLI